jgi:hypothetical protein
LVFEQEGWVERAAGAWALQFDWGGADLEASGGSKAIGPVFGIVGQVKLALLLHGPDKQLAQAILEELLQVFRLDRSWFWLILVANSSIWSCNSGLISLLFIGQTKSGREESSLVLGFFLSFAFLIILFLHLNIDTKLFLHPVGFE